MPSERWYYLSALKLDFYMKKWFLLSIPVILVGVFGYWFWSLAAVPTEEDPVVTLIIQEPGVMVRGPNLTNWEEATSGMQLGEGWSVRTDATGLATIQFFEQGATRLDHDTELTITSAMLTPGRSGADVEMKLDVGRVWSRVLKLFDLDSSYAVRTSSVVATVRGTAFDLEAWEDGSTEVRVTESAVEMRPIHPAEDSEAIAEGSVARFDRAGVMMEQRAMTEEEMRRPWFEQNQQSDEAFVERIRDQQLMALKRLDGPRPDGSLSGLARLSERLHLAVAQGSQRERLAQQYLTRRYFHLITLVEEGKSGLAAQEFARLENYIRTQLKGADGAQEKQRILAALHRVSFLVEDVDSDSALYPFKQRIESLQELLTENRPSAAFYLRLLSIDARLDEVKRYLRRQSYEEARISLDGAANGIENARRELREITDALEADDRNAIEGKVAALREREVGLRERLEIALQPPEVEEIATSTEDGLETEEPSATISETPAASQPPSPPIPPEEPPTPPASQTSVTGIQLFVQPNPLTVGESASLMVMGTLPEGGQQDVSAQSTFELQQSIARLNGPSLTATAAGNTTVTAYYNDGTQTHTASISITIDQAAALESLRIVSSLGTTLSYGQTTSLTAYARYADGYEKDVTSLTSFSKNAGGGTLSGRNYTGTLEVPTETINGRFTENGVTVD
ncbi:hypothetical protein GF380_01625, partial [Candidatus Uhrbacteria bacterium]|nr:hypothetical protein [Candidatus Uhrbacteria bacterium]MBD3283967.1 hypothetical protein [Candidatus Uhrbacteria bacterium]